MDKKTEKEILDRLATIGTATLFEEVNWLMILSASGLAGVLSLLTSIAGLPELEEE